MKILAWLLSIVRPVCPECDGNGGGMSGYYEPEWSDCDCCNPQGRDLEDGRITRVWRWRLWQRRYELWKLDRWIDREMRKEEP